MKIKLRDDTIIVYQGVITKFNVIKPLLEQLDEVRIATKKEQDQYYVVNKQ